jgi:GNAT superfamily N-acetyltransferase
VTSIQRTTHTDAAAVEATAKVMAAVQEHDYPLLVPMTPRMCYLSLKVGWPGRRSEQYLSYRDGEAVGRLELSFSTLDNLNNAYFHVEVVPSARRQGLGRELYSLVLERVRAEGRGLVMTESAWPLPGLPVHDGGAGPAFAQAFGLESANSAAVLRRLDLSTVDETALDELYVKAEEKSGGYRIVQWQDHAPDEHVDDVAYLDGRLLEDAPTGDLALEPEKVDAARVRAAEAAQLARQRKAYNTAVVHEETNRLVAWTAIIHDPELPWHAWQQITIVEPKHRGHRLGVLVKVANLRLMRHHEPQITIVDTGNAAVNSYMISINEQMGFRPLYAWQNWQREL